MKSKKKKPIKKSALMFVRKGDKKRFKLYDVTWKDHSVAAQGASWKSFDEAKVAPILIYSVGYLVDETDEAIALAQNVGTNGMVSEVMTILKSCIVKRKEL